MSLSARIREDIRSVWARGYRPTSLRAHSSIIEEVVKEYNGTDRYIIHHLLLGLDPVEDNSLETWKVIHGRNKGFNLRAASANKQVEENQ